MGERARSIVLGYHTVSDSWDYPAAVRPESLREQLTLLSGAGYRSVTFREAVARPHDHTVAITFDDGFLDVHEQALPLLDELGMIGTVFVPTGVISSGEQLRWDGFDGPDRGSSRDMAPMSWRHVRELVDHGWEIGSHTRSHPHLRQLPDEALLQELTASRAECEAALGGPCTTLAYPYGEVDLRVRSAARRAGFRAAAALGPQWRRGDPLWWPRVGVYRDDDLGRFRQKVHPLAQSRAFAFGIRTARRVVGARG